jgi:hypothetical protein
MDQVRRPRIGFIGCGPFSTGSPYPCLQAFGYALVGDTAIERVVRGDPRATASSGAGSDHPPPLAELVACCDQAVRRSIAGGRRVATTEIRAG